MTRKRDTAPETAGKPFVLLETVPDLGTRGSIKSLNDEQVGELGAKVRPASSRDLEIAGKA
ncbi:hypothetical protein [Roseibium sediminicola]|uniref:Uncharacterized protein n=1 Tax=Roseibium sediminicola TaxID=2933272 RepID=A0ABT0GSC4_9HYPH|nr:hypothetical protein [Roseibium sp. CAU 1639]MCK7611967.1 hypothetical protein [Roseibium sp. CAU 1639]